MNRRQRARKHAMAKAHAERPDGRREPGAELLSVQRHRAKQERREARRRAAADRRKDR